ncbi:hypothetical protein [Streptococcus dentiloxodontae]
MAFVREVIPEEYWGMLKELGVFSDRLRRKLWIADKDRGIYMWTSRFSDRDDRTTDHILIWQNQVININTRTIDNVSHRPIWNEDTTQLLQRGIIEKDINYIKIPTSLVDQKTEVVEIIKEVFHHTSKELDTQFRHIATPEVRE